MNRLQNAVQPHPIAPVPPTCSATRITIDTSNTICTHPNQSSRRNQQQMNHPNSTTLTSQDTKNTTEDIFSLLGHAKLRKLKAWFHLVDLNGDNDLSEKEMKVFFQILHLDLPSFFPTTNHFSKHSFNPPTKMSFEQIIKEFGHLIVPIEIEMPGNDFFQKCKKLKQGFRKCDSDDNMEISIQEFEIATQKLGILLSDLELQKVFTTLDIDQDQSIDWSEFVQAATQNKIFQVSESLGNFFDIESFSDLPSFLRPQEIVPPNNKQNASKNISRLEAYGVKYLTKTHQERLKVVKRSSSSVANVMTINKQQTQNILLVNKIRDSNTQIEPKTMKNVKKTEFFAIMIGSAAGIACGLFSVGFETLLVDTKGFLYYLYLFLLNIFISIIEVNAMYITAVLCAFKLTIITGLTLYPQDAEREFLTRSIARAALQLGHSQDKIFGIDPMKGTPKFILFLSFLFYKTKRHAIKIVLKFLIKRVLWRAAAKVALSLMVLPVNGIMNAWTIRRVMRDCRINILGPPSAVSILELFFLEDDAFSPSQRVDYLRAIASCLVCKRCVHPNVQILLQHARKWLLSAEKWTHEPGCTCLQDPQEACPTHMFDDVKIFYQRLEQLADTEQPTSNLPISTGRSNSDSESDSDSKRIQNTTKTLLQEQGEIVCTSHYGSIGKEIEQERSIDLFDHRRNIFFLIVVTLIIDGGLDWAERKFYVQACIMGGMRNEWKQVMKIRDDLVEGRGICMDHIFDIIDELDSEEMEQTEKMKHLLHHTPLFESLRFLGNRLSSLISI